MFLTIFGLWAINFWLVFLELISGCPVEDFRPEIYFSKLNFYCFGPCAKKFRPMSEIFLPSKIISNISALRDASLNFPVTTIHTLVNWRKLWARADAVYAASLGKRKKRNFRYWNECFPLLVYYNGKKIKQKAMDNRKYTGANIWAIEKLNAFILN